MTTTAPAELRVADNLAFPLDAVTETFLILGKRGSGKTNAATVLTEGMITAGQAVCVVDPTGAWWGLRSSADGQGPGLPVTILGGDHADLPLAADDGAAVADLLVEERLPLVLDTGGLSKTKQRRFMADFLEQVYRRNREPLHLVVDEADLYCPQQATGEIARLVGAYEDIVRRGRLRGIGCTSITQRPAGMHTDVRSQAEVLIALRLIGTHDVAALDKWVQLHAEDADARRVKASLPSLPVGTAWVWSPGWLGILSQVQIRRRRTFDSSATPKVGQARILPREFAPVNPADLERLSARLSQTGSEQEPRAHSTEVTRLRREVTRLREQLAAEKARPRPPLLTEQDAAVIRGAMTALGEAMANLEPLRAALKKLSAPPVQPSRVPLRGIAASPPRPAPEQANGAAPPQLKAGARRMLHTLARHHPMRVTRAQLATLSGFKVTGGTFSTYLSTLRANGLITEDSKLITEDSKLISVTEAGLTEAGVTAPEPMTPGELLEQWRGALKAGARNMLDIVLAAGPGGITRADLATAAGFELTGGTFGTYLGTLRANGLITVDGQAVRPSDVFTLQEAGAE